MSQPFEADLWSGSVYLTRDAAHRYRVSVDGGPERTVPSVTQILTMLNKPALVAWSARTGAELLPGLFERDAELGGGIWIVPEEYIETWMEEIKTAHERARDAAGLVGTLVHAWLEDALRRMLWGEVNFLTPPEGEWVTAGVHAACSEIIDWLADVRPLGMEHPVYSKRWHYTGQTDYILDVAGRVGVWDMKTGKNAYGEVMVQLAAYAAALIEEGVLQVRDPDRGVIFLERGRDGDLTGHVEFIELKSDMSSDYMAFQHLLALHSWSRRWRVEMRQAREG